MLDSRSRSSSAPRSVRPLPRPPVEALALLAAVLAAATPAAAQQVSYALSGAELTGIEVEGVVYAADDLRLGSSSGAVQFIGSGGQPITAADDLNVATYFARAAVQPDLWRVDLPEPWSDPSGAAPDFFVLEAGGNDSLRVAPRLGDGSLGQEVVLASWQPLGTNVAGGPNAGQPLAALAFSGTDLRDAAGQALGADDVVVALELRSPSVDGAVLTYRDSIPTPAVPRARPTIVASLGQVPSGDDFQTPVTLTAEAPGVAGPVGWLWDIPGAVYVDGTESTSQSVTVLLPGDRPTFAEVLAVPLEAPDSFGKARFELGLSLPGGARLFGTPRAAQKLELWFDGPELDVFSEAPNPFLDRRLDVRFTRPDGSLMVVPGFYDGDGRGSESGSVWKVRLTPDQAGAWGFRVTFRAGTDVAVAADSSAGSPTAFSGLLGTIEVEPRDPAAPGFLRRGHLRQTDGHYPRFDDGRYWIKGGTNSPENLLAFRGFDGVVDGNLFDGLHEFAAHEELWQITDPELPLGTWDGDRALIGALEYLESQGVNGIYFLPLNLGGDGWDTAPFVGISGSPFDNTHYAVRRLHQWETVLWEATKRGIHLQFVLAETEVANEQWLDGGDFGTERKLFYRELVARFGHHLALTWNLSEENDFVPAVQDAKGEWLAALDPYDHAVTFHIRPDEISDFVPFYGDPDFTTASIQYTPDKAGQLTEEVRVASAAAGEPWMVAMDENTPATIGLTDTNADDLRKRVLYDVLFSGGHVEWYAGQHPLPLGGDLNLEDFATREAMWGFTRRARAVLESLPFWLMEPGDGLVSSEFVGEFGEAEAFVRTGEAYAVFLPDARFGAVLDLSAAPGPFTLRWYDPREGEYVGAPASLEGGAPRALGLPPSQLTEDWVAVVRRPSLWTPQAQVSLAGGATVPLELDAGPVGAGLVYLVLGSLTGTNPGTPLGNGLVLPLFPDPYFLATLVGTAPIADGLGVLDEAGRATASLTLPGDPALAGWTLHHAWLADPLGLQIPSVPASVTLVP